ncbi:MAG: MBL fold metallo-hydrolase [Clostridia bacterium]|nr:MBL fold metallo-hydrolase [Clostridia bacterium]
MNKKLKRLALPLLSAAALPLALSLWPDLGHRPRRAEKAAFARRVNNHREGRFQNQIPLPMDMAPRYTDPHAHRTTGRPAVPVKPLPVQTPELGGTGDSLTWLGHASLLLRLAGRTLLYDPVLCDRTAPVSFAGPRRYTALPLRAAQFPSIDLCLYSHDHYDHLDRATVRALDARVRRYLVPLGVGGHLRRWGVRADKITELGWWEQVRLGPLTLTCVPAQHFSGRGLFDRFETLWCGWHLATPDRSLLLGGDGGPGPHFAEIRRRLGPPDLACLDSAQYNIRWHGVHLFPEEAVEAACQLGAVTAMPIHWGAYCLSDHAWDDPPARFTRHAAECGLNTLTPRIGETVPLEALPPSVSWWAEMEEG